MLTRGYRVGSSGGDLNYVPVISELRLLLLWCLLVVFKTDSARYHSSEFLEDHLLLA